MARAAGRARRSAPGRVPRWLLTVMAVVVAALLGASVLSVATASGGDLAMTAGVFAIDVPHRVRVDVSGSDPRALGERAADRLLELGAADILAACLAAKEFS